MKTKTGLLLPMIVLTLISNCSDNGDSEAKTDLLVDTQWFNSEITNPVTGYSAVSPIVFLRDKKVYLGGSPAVWGIVDNGNAILITYPSTNISNKYVIKSLTATEFQFKHYDGMGNYLAELKYGKCNPLLPLSPC